VFQLSQVEHFAMNCLTSKKEVIGHTLDAEKKPERFRVLFAYEKEGPVSPKVISSVNLLPVDMGGTHVNFFFDVLKDFFQAKAKKYDYKFQPNDCLYRLRAYLMLSLVEPKFSAQTKDKLTNRKTDFNIYVKDFKDQLEYLFSDNEEQLKGYLDIFQDYRRKLDSKKLNTNGSSTRRASTQFTKLRDCVSKSGELFIVEGESAGGSIIQSRDRNNHAVLPLKGKSIPNVTTRKDILKNKEVGELVKAIGAGVGPHFDISKMRYSKIICATDADHDGNHIACLVSILVAILLPDIVKAGRYYIAQTPLFAINDGKLFKPLWTEKELEKARKRGKKIQRYKGLGEMNPEQLKVCLLDEETRNLVPLQYSSNIDDLVKLFASAEEKRKLVGE